MVQTQSANLVNSDLNNQWKQFLRKKVNSFIKWDLVRFFHDNPHTADTAENIANFVGRDTTIVNRELEGLVKTGVLEQASASGEMIYRLTDDTEIRKQLQEFVAACHNRDFRVQAINHVMHGMGFVPRRSH